MGMFLQGEFVDDGCWAGFLVGLSVLVCSRWVCGDSLLWVERLFVCFLSLYFWATLWVFLVVFSVGHVWSMLHLGGSGVLSQGAGYGIFGVCFLFPR